MSSIAEVVDLSKVFIKGQKPALDHIHLKIPVGKIVGLVGPDGAGKTTLIRFLAALLMPTTGEVIVDGYNTIQSPQKVHEVIGYMPQRFGLYEDLTVEQNLNLYADLQGIPKEEKGAIFEKLLKFTELKPFTKRLSGNLSGGMKQKLGLACTLIRKPKLLLLDEPSVGVDPISRRELWNMVRNLLKEDVSVVWSTSYIDEAEACDFVILLNGGKILFDGHPEEMTRKIEGRTFKILDAGPNRRKLLMDELKKDEVEDGVIQGDAIRLLMRKKGQVPEGKVEKVAPKFEDAFIDALGGGPGGASKLAEEIKPIPKKSDEVIIADKLTKKFGTFTAVDAISFVVKPGEIFGLLGPNGAGKSTTFKMLCGLLKPTLGNSSVYGYDLQKAPEIARKQIGYMAQKFSLYGNLSVRQNLSFFAGIYQVETKQKMEEMIEIFSLQPFLSTEAGALPLGFKQRLALACSVMHNPPVLFLDEPTSGVDPITRREFWNHINGLVQKGITVMVTTHFMDEAEYCDRIALVYRGKMIQLGTPDALKARAGPHASLEDAFIELIKKYDEEHQGG